MRFVALAAVFLVQAAFEAFALLFKPTILWIVVPAMTVAFYFYARLKGNVYRIDVFIISAVIGGLLSYDLIGGYLASLSSGAGEPLTGSLFYGIAYFAFSNVMCLLGAHLLVGLRPSR